MFDLKNYEEYLKNAKLNDCFICQNKSDKIYIATNDDALYKNNENYFVINGKYQGGAITLFPKDIVFTWFSDKSLLRNIIDDITNFLCDYPIQIELNNNDFLINGKKLFGTMYKQYNNMCYEGMFFSFDPDKTIIKSICQKDMKKEPIGLRQYNITSDDIIKLCKNICKKYNLKEV